jgi:hypothetical protein
MKNYMDGDIRATVSINRPLLLSVDFTGRNIPSKSLASGIRMLQLWR